MLNSNRALQASMSDLTVDEFLATVQRSQLIDKNRLRKILSDRGSGVLPQGVDGVAQLLLSEGHLTQWQTTNLLAGKTRGYFLGGYRLLDHIGTGGMSSVFLAQHGLIDRLVAIKVLPASRVEDVNFRERFLREARMTARLSHPNIVRVFDTDHEGDTYYMVMEYVPGRDLKAITRSGDPLSLEQAAFYIAQAATGLQHAHDCGLVHRDIKPANLVVNDNDVLKILDLGLAFLQDGELETLTLDRSGGMMGTADYLAPEQARNAHGVDHRADIYSLGCTLYFLLAGRAPFTEGTMAERILMHQNQRPSDVRAYREDCPHALADVCMQMLEKDPGDRPQSAGLVAVRLQRYLRTHGTSPGRADVGHGVRSDLIHTGVSETLQPTMSVSEERRLRQQVRPAAPAGLWIFLSMSAVVCVVLLVYLLLRGR